MESVKDLLKTILIVFAIFLGIVLLTAGPQKAAETAIGGFNFVKQVATSIVVFVDKVVEGL